MAKITIKTWFSDFLCLFAPLPEGEEYGWLPIGGWFLFLTIISYLLMTTH